MGTHLKTMIPPWKNILLFYFEKIFKRGSNFKILHIWKVYRIFIFHPISKHFFPFELIVLRAYRILSVNFPHLCLIGITLCTGYDLPYFLDY